MSSLTFDSTNHYPPLTRIFRNVLAIPKSFLGCNHDHEVLDQFPKKKSLTVPPLRWGKKNIKAQVMTPKIIIDQYGSDIFSFVSIFSLQSAATNEEWLCTNIDGALFL